jgi:tetratricopeptide (TPR) repeat protein
MMKKFPAVAAAVIMAVLALPWHCLGASGDYEKGVAYLRAGKAAEAVKILEPLAASGKDDPYVYYHLGIAYTRTGRFGDAYDALKKSDALARGRSRDELGFGVAYSNLGVEAYRAGSLKLAEKSLDDALDANPGDGDSTYYLGLIKMQDGDYDSALEEFDKAARLLSGDEAASVTIGNAAALAHYKKGDNDAALSGFSASLEKDPDNIEALYYMAEISYKEHSYEAAKPYYDRIAQAGAPDENTKKALFTTFFNMGVDFQDRGRAETAADMFERATLIKPDDAEAHYYLGYNLMALKRYEEASAEFKQALSLHPGLERAKAQLEMAGRFAADKATGDAAARFEAGDYYAALPLYEKALSLDPANKDAKKGVSDSKAAIKADTDKRVAIARDLLAKGDYTGAKSASDELARLNPGSSEASVLDNEIRTKLASATGSLLKKAADAEAGDALGEAAKDYQALLDIDPGNGKAKDGLARASGAIDAARKKAAKAAGDGLLADARAAYRKLLVYLPGDPDALAGLKSVEDSIQLELARLIKDAEESFGAEDYTMAAHHVERALELDPDNSEAAGLREKIKSRTTELVEKYIREGDSQLAEGLRDKAADSYEAALTYDPSNKTAKAGLSKARQAQAAPGSEDEIRRLYLQGVEHYTQGELELAIESWRELLRIDPGNEKAASSIKRAQEKMRQSEEDSGTK